MQPSPPEPLTPLPPDAHGQNGGPGAPPALAFSNVTLAPGARTVLRDASFSVRQGEFIGVLGPNGAGKTTLMRAALGLVPAVRGAIHVLGEPVAGSRRGNPSIGYMPQTRSALSSRRVRGRDFVAMAADGHRWGLPHASAATRADVERALALVDARALAERTLSELSGGERQRLLLAQCLLGQPKLLLLDEPLISLDPNHQRGVVELVRRVQRELNIAVLFSAHELNPLLNALDRVLYLGNGAAALGNVDEVITAPVLSRLYGAPIDVMRTHGRIFVMSGGVEIDKHDHEHEHDEHGHGGHGHAGNVHGGHDHGRHGLHAGNIHGEHVHDERGHDEHGHHDDHAHDGDGGHGERRPHAPARPAMSGRSVDPIANVHDEHGHHDGHAHDGDGSHGEHRPHTPASPAMNGHSIGPTANAHDHRAGNDRAQDNARATPRHHEATDATGATNATLPTNPAAAHDASACAPHPHTHPHTSTPDA